MKSTLENRAMTIGSLVVVERRNRTLIVGRVHRVAPLVVAVSGTARRVRVGASRSVRVVVRLPRALLAMVSELQHEGRSFTKEDIGINTQSFPAQPRPRWKPKRKRKRA